MLHERTTLFLHCQCFSFMHWHLWLLQPSIRSEMEELLNCQHVFFLPEISVIQQTPNESRWQKKKQRLLCKNHKKKSSQRRPTRSVLGVPHKNEKFFSVKTEKMTYKTSKYLFFVSPMLHLQKDSHLLCIFTFEPKFSFSAPIRVCGN